MPATALSVRDPKVSKTGKLRSLLLGICFLENKTQISVQDISHIG